MCAINCCLSASFSSKNSSFGLCSISECACCLPLLAAGREKKPCTWLLVNHSSRSNNLLFCSSLVLRISFETCWGSAFGPDCSPRSNFAVRYFLTLSVNLMDPARGLCRAQPIMTVCNAVIETFSLWRILGSDGSFPVTLTNAVNLSAQSLRSLSYSVSDGLSTLTQWSPTSKCDSSSENVWNLFTHPGLEHSNMLILESSQSFASSELFVTGSEHW